MIFAEIHGKLGADCSRAHDRAEDLLTSTVFGLLRYVPAEPGLLSLLRRARPIRLSEAGGSLVRESDWIDVQGISTFDVEFWPSFGRFGQPDLLLRLRDKSGSVQQMCLVELKLHAPKSGSAFTDGDSDAIADDTPEEAPDPDQLVKSWQGLRRHPEAF